MNLVSKMEKKLEKMNDAEINEELLEISVGVFSNNTDPDIENPMSELIQVWAGSNTGEMDEDGDIWVCDPMFGNWLDIESKKDFIVWVEAQDDQEQPGYVKGLF